LAALHDGLAHGSRIAPRDPLPNTPVTLIFTANATLPIELVAVYYTTDGSEPRGQLGRALAGRVVEAEPGVPATDSHSGLAVREWRATIPAQPEGTLVRYRAEGWSVRGQRQVWYADRADPVSGPYDQGRVFAYSVDSFAPPEWFADAVIYQVCVDRFSAGENQPPLRDPGIVTGFYGGTLMGVLAKLEYIQSLGANCLWLTPIFESPSHHGYDPSSYYYVARRYGTNETLRALIHAAHEREMRIILDFVANHTSREHPLFQRAAADPQSTLRSWYTFGDAWPYGYRTYASERDMPVLNTEHPDVQRYLATAAGYWLSDLGADGLRLDHAVGPSLAFWAIFQRDIKQTQPYALTLGEVTEAPADLATYEGRMDAIMDFELMERLRQVFATRSESLDTLLAYLDERAERKLALRWATMLDNHDVDRFLWLARGDTRRLRLAATCLMTLEGTPILYYGTEVGVSQATGTSAEHAYARAPMLWGEGQDRTLLAHFRALGTLRQRHPALRHGQRLRLPVVPVAVMAARQEAERQAGAYMRFTDTEYLIIALNNTEAPLTMRIDLARGLALASPTIHMPPTLGYRLDPSRSDELPVAFGVVEVDLPPLGAAVLGPE
jgi:glycosidase